MFTTKLAGFLAVAIAVLCNSTSALVVQSNVTITDIVKDIAITLRSRRATNPLTCAKIAVIYSEPVSKTFEMTLSTKQLAGIDAIDSSFALSAGKFAVEVKMTADDDPNAACSEVADDWGVASDINGIVTYGTAVDFYGLTSTHDYYIPVAKTIMVICFETSAAEELDVRDQYHYDPVIANLNSCPQVSIGASCDVDITGATLNKWEDLNKVDLTVYDNDWVQKIEVASIKDVANNLEIPTKFMFATTSSQEFLSLPVVIADQNDVGRTKQRTDNFFSSSKSKFALSQSRGFQKVVISAGAPLPAVGSFVGTDSWGCIITSDCFEVVATKYTPTEMFYIVHTQSPSLSLTNDALPNVYYYIKDNGNMFVTNPGMSQCTDCVMGELYPVNYEVTINVIGREGVGEYTVGGAAAADQGDSPTPAIACTSDGSSTDCKRATQTFAFTMTDVDEVKVGAMIAHAPVSVADGDDSYVPTAKIYDQRIAASMGTDASAKMVLTVTDDDFTSSELSKAVFLDTTKVYTEELKLQVTVTTGAQVASAGCSGLVGGSKYLRCPDNRTYTTDVIAATIDNEGLSVTKDDSEYTLTYDPSYACPVGVTGCDDDNKLAYYGTQYCTIIAQFSDNTASLSDDLTVTQKSEIGIYQTLPDQQGTKHTFLFGATSYSEHDYSVIVSPVVKFAALSRRSFAQWTALSVNDETWASIQLKTTNRAKPNSGLNSFPLGRIVAPNNDGNCATDDYDTNFVDGSSNKMCCSRLASTYGTYISLYETAVPACDDGSGPCMGDGQCEDSCTQTLGFSLKSPGTAGSANYPFAEVGDYELCVVYANAQFPYDKEASVLSTTIQITTSRRAAREEGEEAQAPPQPQEQSIFFDISPGSIMTVRLGSDEETEIVISPGTPQAPAAPTTPSPTPALTLEGDDTQGNELFLLGFIFGGILLLIIIVAVAVTMLSRQRKQQSKVYPFWMPGAGADKPPQFTPATSTFTTSA